MAADRTRSSPAIACLSRSSSIGFDHAGWKNCWGGLMCFTPKRRVKYHSAEMCSVPQLVSEEVPAATGSLIIDTPNQLPLLPPVMGAPPSSPVSVGVTHETTLPDASTASLLSHFPEGSNRSCNCFVDATQTNANSRSFVLDDALVTPPLNSPSTTATATPLSTAPFTPPPELAHLTTPSSPEVLSTEPPENSCTEFRSSLLENCEQVGLQTFPTTHLQLIHWLHSCSPIDQLVKYNSGASSPESLEGLPERASIQKESTYTNDINPCFLFARDNESFEGTEMATSEIICDRDIINQRQDVRRASSCLQKKIPGIPKALEVYEQEVNKCSGSSTDSGGHCRRPKTHGIEVCCSKCGELSAKCKDLSEALEQTKKKLKFVELKVSSMDERERRFKHFIQWMQLSLHWLAGLVCKHGALCMVQQAKLRQDKIFQLSRELSWQGSALLDLQQCHLAEANISDQVRKGIDIQEQSLDR